MRFRKGEEKTDGLEDMFNGLTHFGAWSRFIRFGNWDNQGGKSTTAISNSGEPAHIISNEILASEGVDAN